MSNFDLTHNKSNLFSSDHCEGKVIYWTHTAPAAAIPIEMQGLHGFIFPMQLDGKDVETQIDTASQLCVTLAHRLRQESLASQTTRPRTPDLLPQISKENPIHSKHLPPMGSPLPTLKSIFITMRLPKAATVKIANSPIRSMTKPTQNLCAVSVLRKLVIGRAEMQHLRMYFAFRERRLYVTAADAN